MVTKLMILSAALGLGAAGIAAPAWAHAFLEHASPPAGGHVAAAPKQIALFYTEGVAPHFSHVAVLGPAGTVAVGALHAEKDGRELVVPLPATLRPGTYTVTWQVTALDTHKTHGSFKFTIGG